MTDIVKLSNGLRVVVENIPYTRSISLGFFVLNGSAYEDSTNNGISHFIEHMFFKGTKNRTAKHLADNMDEIGGQMNAYTAKEYTCFYAKVLDEHFDNALEILCDMFFNSNFDEDEIEKEKTVIKEEIKMVEDMPEDLVTENLFSGVWRGDPLGLTILGTEESIDSFDKKTFLDYMDSHFMPKNTVVSIAGNIDTNTAVKKVEKYFNSWKNDRDIPVLKPSVYKKCFVKADKNIEQLHLALAFNSVESGTDKSYDLAAINTLLGSSTSSLLFQKIREQHSLAYSVYSFSTAYKTTGVFTIYSAINPDNYEKTLKLIYDEIKRLKNEGISTKQLIKAKQQIKSSFVLSTETSSSKCSANGRGLILLNKAKSLDETIEKIEAITVDSVNSLINEVFDMNNASISVVGKTKNIKQGEFYYE